jgi:phosphoribosylanthranilate isomerase
MPSTLIKICGISTPYTLDATIAAHADYCGFMFFAPSPRNLAFETASQLAARAGDRIGKVGVFVDPGDSLLTDAIAAGRLDAVQLHKVTGDRRAEVKQRFGLPVWAVMPIKTRGDLACRGHMVPETQDRVLYDAATPKGADLPGGMGVRFNWNWMEGLEHPYPWGLAGGLSADNVAEAIRITGAPLVDTSSGVESAPGIKDVDRIAAFCKAAQNI